MFPAQIQAILPTIAAGNLKGDLNASVFLRRTKIF